MIIYCHNVKNLQKLKISMFNFVDSLKSQLIDINKFCSPMPHHHTHALHLHLTITMPIWTLMHVFAFVSLRHSFIESQSIYIYHYCFSMLVHRFAFLHRIIVSQCCFTTTMDSLTIITSTIDNIKRKGGGGKNISSRCNSNWS